MTLLYTVLVWFLLYILLQWGFVPGRIQLGCDNQTYHIRRHEIWV